jgi:hypothetical protein
MLGRDALLRDPALHVSTAFFAHDRGMFWVCNLHWTCGPGSRGSASQGRSLAIPVLWAMQAAVIIFFSTPSRADTKCLRDGND